MSKSHNIFISWSGESSRFVAEAVHQWLPGVVQAARPFLSTNDIEKGSRGLHEIMVALDGIKVGIVCLTPDNLEAPWLLYESGALSKTIDINTRLCTYLLGGLRPQDIKPPLGMFQHTEAKKDETKKLVRAINAAIADDPVAENILDKTFEQMWPDLETSIREMPPLASKSSPKRSSEEMIAEILELSRFAASSRKDVEWMNEYIPVLKRVFPMLDQALKTAQAQMGKAAPAGAITERSTE